MKLIRVIKRSSGIYHIDYELNGKIKRQSTKEKTKIGALKYWHRFFETYTKKKSEYQEKITIDISVNDACKKYIDHLKKNVQISTFNADRYRIEKFCNFIRKSCKNTNEINEKHVHQFFKENDFKNKTHNNYLSAINKMFEFFIDHDYMLKNPVHVKRKGQKKERVEIPSKKDAQIIIDYIFTNEKNEVHKTAMLLPFLTGLRLSEVRGLNINNIDLVEKKIKVYEKMTFENAPTKKLKSSAGYRTVPILSYFDIDLQFSNEYPFKELKYNLIVKKCKKISHDTGIKYTYHMSRHFFCSLLIENKTNIKTIQTIMGHEKINTTIDTYGHLIQDWNSSEFDGIKIK